MTPPADGQPSQTQPVAIRVDGNSEGKCVLAFLSDIDGVIDTITGATPENTLLPEGTVYDLVPRT